MHSVGLTISIIIPAFNEERLLGETLARVKAALPGFSRHGWQTELIVCDNNSSDATPELARAAGARVVFEPVNQIGRARNRGAMAAVGQWLVFVDADSHPTLELFGEVAEQIQGGRCLAGGCTVRLAGRHPAANLVVRLWNGLSRTATLLAGSFIFCESAAFRELGGFSQELFVGEELELSQRLKRYARAAGKKVVVLHRHPLLTSPRKTHLYTPLEHTRFLLRAALRGRKALTSREACHPWYDGRR